jgi:hypothetical protein
MTLLFHARWLLLLLLAGAVTWMCWSALRHDRS